MCSHLLCTGTLAASKSAGILPGTPAGVKGLQDSFSCAKQKENCEFCNVQCAAACWLLCQRGSGAVPMLAFHAQATAFECDLDTALQMHATYLKAAAKFLSHAARVAVSWAMAPRIYWQYDRCGNTSRVLQQWLYYIISHTAACQTCRLHGMFMSPAGNR